MKMKEIGPRLPSRGSLNEQAWSSELNSYSLAENNNILRPYTKDFYLETN